MSHRIGWLTVAEGALALYFLGGLALAFYVQDFRMFVLHIMLMVGFGMVSLYSVVQAGRQTARQPVRAGDPAPPPVRAVSA